MPLDILNTGESKPEEAPTVPGSSTSLDLNKGATPPEGTSPAGRPEYVPEQFWRAVADDPTKGEAHLEAWGKAWHDTKATLTKTQQEMAELRKASNLPAAPGDAKDYFEGYDFEALAQAAPRAFKGGGAENVTIQALQAAGFKHGLSVEQMRGVATDLFTALNEHVPEEQTYAEALAAQVKSLGTEGARLASRVNNALETLHGQEEFSESQQHLMKQILASDGGIGLMDRVLMQGGSTPPPTMDAKGGERMTQYEIQQAMQSPRYRKDDVYREKIHAAHAALVKQQANGADAAGVHRTLKLG